MMAKTPEVKFQRTRVCMHVDTMQRSRLVKYDVSSENHTDMVRVSKQERASNLWQTRQSAAGAGEIVS